MRSFIGQLLEKKDLVGAEIGVYHGGNAIEILNFLDIKKLHLVDHYSAYHAPEAQVFVPQEKQDESKKLAFDNLGSKGEKIEWHLKPSVEAAKEIKDDSLDFVYIDATHSYDALTEDLNTWYPKIKKGGLVSGHDWHYDFIQKAVHNFADPKDHKITDSEDWWFKK